MSDALIFLGFAIVWFVMIRFVLPRLGVSTSAAASCRVPAEPETDSGSRPLADTPSTKRRRLANDEIPFVDLEDGN